MVAGPDGKPRVVQPSPRPAGRPAPGSKPAEEAAKGQEGKPGEGGKPDAKKEEEKKPAVTERPTEPSAPPDPKELEVRPGEDGKVAFSFRNQPWPALLEWFAEVSGQPLDWRELPADHVNLASTGRYTLDEVRDLLNRHLLSRGFTLLQLDGGVTVAKTAEINPALVPRVDASTLGDLQPHSFVRTSLDVGWLSAEALAEELKPMISSNGRLVAMKSTNRIEAMDAAVNLRQVAQLLAQEQSAEARDELAPEFELRYISAEDAKSLLEQFLGIDKKSQPAPMTPQQIQMMQQQQARSGGNQPQPQPAEKKAEISIVANLRRNSIIIHAPADRIAVATEFIKRIDVPTDAMQSLTDLQARVHIFRLASLDPEKLAEIISEMNILEPTTRMRVDKENRALVVTGSIADRFIINSMVERLDGSGRKFEVLQLRRLDAQEVADSIAFLMGTEDDKDDSSSRNRYSYYGYFGNQNEETKEKDQFRVAANARYRQVLLWANEMEMDEVRNLLIKLGELPPPGGSERTVRMIDAAPTPDTYRYLQQLREQFQRIAPNPIELPDADAFREPNERPAAEKDADGEDSDGPEGKPVPVEPDPLAHQHDAALPYTFTTAALQNAAPEAPPEGDDAEADGDGAEAAAPGDASRKDARESDPSQTDGLEIRSSEDFDRLFGSPDRATRAGGEGQRTDGRKSKAGAPVRIELDARGNLLLISPDTEALDALENLMLQVAPPTRPYQIFYVQHASAYWVQLNLEDYFDQAEDDDDGGRSSFWDYYYGMGQEEEEGPAGLGQGAKLRFISDVDTGSIVVTGATPEQLRTIDELIKLWDVPEPMNKRSMRFTKLVPVRYSKAETLAETVKDAYRDLLSSNDKAFRSGGNQGGGRSGSEARNTERNRDGGGSGLRDTGGSEQSSGDGNFTFKGKLSVGVDPVGNTLLVSAEGEDLLKLVCDMIDQLDQAARPQGDVQVHRTNGTVSIQALEAALRAFSADGPGSLDEPRGRPTGGEPRAGREAGGGRQITASEAAPQP